MYNWLKARRNLKMRMRDIYSDALARSRDPQFYNEFGVPDTFDGRFEMVCLQVVLEMHKLADPKEQQALFDVMFRNMEKSLRELGIGDLGVPKHIKRMMKAYKGRYHYYVEALEKGNKEDLKSALRRNAYGTLDDVNAQKIDAFADYIMTQFHIEAQDLEKELKYG